MHYKVEDIHPYGNKHSKKEQVADMFNQIAGGYDRLNGLLSLGKDGYWRRQAIKVLKKYPHNLILDVATGTGDFALLANKILKPQRIVGVDISEGMMEEGRKKVAQKGLEHIITFDKQDCSSLSFQDDTFDAVTIAFGVRNFENIDDSFGEVLRVLKPGGVFLFLELTSPQLPPVKQVYNLYSTYIMPSIARLLKAEKRAYEYLPESIAAFPQGKEMMEILKANGFTNIRLRRLTMEICTLYIAEKPKG